MSHARDECDDHFCGSGSCTIYCCKLCSRKADDLKSDEKEEISDEPTCGTCGSVLEAVRPGKHQCNMCDAEREIERLTEADAISKAEISRLQAEIDQIKKDWIATASASRRANYAAYADMEALRAALESAELSQRRIEVKALRKEIAGWMTEINLLRDIAIAAAQLRNSGYDGPFIGEICSPLFKALRKLETR